MPTLNGAVVLVTGANGGIGTHFVHEALARGAAKVYATARTPRDWSDDRIVPLALDVTDPESIAALVTAAPDVTVLINNAGMSPSSPDILSHSDDEIRANVETNFLGPLFLARAFTPILSANAPSAIVDIHSALSWHASAGIYSATKAALWSATNSLRVELAPAGVHVVGVHVGWVDTAMAAHATGPKLHPSQLVAQVLDATEADVYEVLADDTSVQLKAALSAPLEAVYPQLAKTPLSDDTASVVSPSDVEVVSPTKSRVRLRRSPFGRQRFARSPVVRRSCVPYGAGALASTHSDAGAG